MVPVQRIAEQFRDLSLSQIRTLIKDAFHECRLTALFILVHRFDRADASEQIKIVQFYLSQLGYVRISREIRLHQRRLRDAIFQHNAELGRNECVFTVS